jgi:DNA-binding GntR family transcriptional regulator
VSALPRRGFVVAPLHREDLVDLFEVEARLTAELAARATGRVDDAGAALLARLTREVEARSAEADAAGGEPDGALPHDRPDRLVDAERALHVALNRIAGSRKLAWLAGRTANYVPRTFYTRSRAWRTAATSAHRALLDAVTTGDAERARAAMTTHVLDGRDLLLAHLDTVGLWSPAQTAPRDPEETPCP